MNRFFLLGIILLTIISCNVDSVDSDLLTDPGQAGNQNENCLVDATNPPQITGTTWIRTSVVIETAIDGNGDGIFSTNLEDETMCAADPLEFRNDFLVDSPLYDNFSFTTTVDGNGNPVQQVNCLIGDGLFPTYTQDDNTIYFCSNGELQFTGTLSADQQTLTFVFAAEDYLFGRTIVNPDGTTVEYDGNVTITYSLQ